MASSNNNGFRLGLEYLIPLAFLLLIAGGPIQQFLFGDRTASLLSTNEAPVVDAEKLVVPDANLACPPHSYETHILSTEPLVVYISGFLSDAEADHLVDISLPHFAPSTVWSGNSESLDPTVRVSEKAPLPRDTTVKCIEERARAFQGWRPDVFVERLWSQRYGPGGHYVHHYDGGPGRVSSFMVYLAANCTGGGTNFPRLKVPGERKKWCEFVECDEDGEGAGGVKGTGEGNSEVEKLEGVTFKPIKGNAVFWLNYGPDGRGYEEAWHAGLPVTAGTKVGLNIWSWYQKGLRAPET